MSRSEKGTDACRQSVCCPAFFPCGSVDDGLLRGTSGEIDGQPVGTRYVNRALLLEAGMHGSIRRGIYSFKETARSVVL